eukprot:CAMPEP_0203853078 /NCGR_PEP_ID=MMETSP0359-20131031/8320_1 /ASSEMBLY_ACC=CAM_ASM_000338 /TAXON_ID=268821 /ORGANISM="Scrippsiella Hangoei, Strain SHTV-5" /LENGTH=70 /DNA_ID=CAMNT_0050769373 /DNA_START=1 /DNA_END=210 /DNA_ORIENTATION=-
MPQADFNANAFLQDKFATPAEHFPCLLHASTAGRSGTLGFGKCLSEVLETLPILQHLVQASAVDYSGSYL